MKKLTAKQIQENWDNLIGIIEKQFTGDRKDGLLKIYLMKILPEDKKPKKITVK